jgi:hypothetical protein
MWGKRPVIYCNYLDLRKICLVDRGGVQAGKGDGMVAGSPFWTSRRANPLILQPIRRCAILEQCSILGYLDDVVRLQFAPKGMNIYDSGHGSSYAQFVVSVKIRRAPQQRA